MIEEWRRDEVKQIPQHLDERRKEFYPRNRIEVEEMNLKCLEEIREGFVRLFAPLFESVAFAHVEVEGKCSEPLEDDEFVVRVQPKGATHPIYQAVAATRMFRM